MPPTPLPSPHALYLPMAYARADRSERVQGLGAAIASGVANLVRDLGLDAHELLAVTVTAIDVFARRHAEPGSRALLLRLLAREIERRASPHAATPARAQPLGKTFGEQELVRVTSRLVADVRAVQKLCPEIGAFEPSTIAAALRVMAEAGFQRCRVCGCSDYDACPGGCSWIEHDLCSRCAGVTEGDHPAAASATQSVVAEGGTDA